MNSVMRFECTNCHTQRTYDDFARGYLTETEACDAINHYYTSLSIPLALGTGLTLCLCPACLDVLKSMGNEHTYITVPYVPTTPDSKDTDNAG